MSLCWHHVRPPRWGEGAPPEGTWSVSVRGKAPPSHQQGFHSQGGLLATVPMNASHLECAVFPTWETPLLLSSLSGGVQGDPRAVCSACVFNWEF